MERQEDWIPVCSVEEWTLFQEPLSSVTAASAGVISFVTHGDISTPCFMTNSLTQAEKLSCWKMPTDPLLEFY